MPQDIEAIRNCINEGNVDGAMKLIYKLADERDKAFDEINVLKSTVNGLKERIERLEDTINELRSEGKG